MKLRVVLLIAFLAIAASIGTYELRAVPQDSYPRPCVVNVPPSWGEFKGISKFGFVFEDKEGTLRIIDQMPCSDEHIGLNSTPRVSVEVRRK